MLFATQMSRLGSVVLCPHKLHGLPGNMILADIPLEGINEQQVGLFVLPIFKPSLDS